MALLLTLHYCKSDRAWKDNQVRDSIKFTLKYSHGRRTQSEEVVLGGFRSRVATAIAGFRAAQAMEPGLFLLANLLKVVLIDLKGQQSSSFAVTDAAPKGSCLEEAWRAVVAILVDAEPGSLSNVWTILTSASGGWRMHGSLSTMSWLSACSEL